MLQVQIIGNLGADAEVKTANGRQFVSFNVAHTERWSGADGAEHEDTIWVSCAMSGDGGRVLPYLKRGASVFCQGRASLRVYSSAKVRGMVAGLNVSVDRLELVGGRADDVPRELVAEDGRVLRTNRAYYVDASAAGDLMPALGAVTMLHGSRGGDFQLDSNGFVWPFAQPKDAENGKV